MKLLLGSGAVVERSDFEEQKIKTNADIKSLKDDMSFLVDSTEDKIKE